MKNEWRDVRVIDGTKLIDWTLQFLPVELWLAQRLGMPAQQIETPEQRWSLTCSIGEPPPLKPKLFLANRDEACAKIKEVFAGTTVQRICLPPSCSSVGPAGLGDTRYAERELVLPPEVWCNSL